MSDARIEALQNRTMRDGASAAVDVMVIEPTAYLVSKSKLVITMGTSQTLDVSTTRSGKTRVQVFRRGATTFEKTFSRVRSLDVSGSSYDDFINLGQGVRPATVHAGRGDDAVAAYNDLVIAYGGEGDDRLYGRDGDDSLYGEAGNDRLYGAGGNDLLSGGSGKDFLIGGGGENRLVGGPGTDRLVVASDDFTDHDAKDHIRELFARVDGD